MKINKKLLKIEERIFEIDHLHAVLKNSLKYCGCSYDINHEHIYVCELIEKKIKEIQNLF